MGVQDVLYGNHKNDMLLIKLLLSSLLEALCHHYHHLPPSYFYVLHFHCKFASSIVFHLSFNTPCVLLSLSMLSCSSILLQVFKLHRASLVVLPPMIPPPTIVPPTSYNSISYKCNSFLYHQHCNLLLSLLFFFAFFWFCSLIAIFSSFFSFAFLMVLFFDCFAF